MKWKCELQAQFSSNSFFAGCRAPSSKNLRVLSIFHIPYSVCVGRVILQSCQNVYKNKRIARALWMVCSVAVYVECIRGKCIRGFMCGKLANESVDFVRRSIGCGFLRCVCSSIRDYTRIYCRLSERIFFSCRKSSYSHKLTVTWNTAQENGGWVIEKNDP